MSTTFEKQEKRLRQDPTLRMFAESRRALATDRYRPIYHFVSPINNLNDPNGLCYWQGRWHLFYQTRPPNEPVYQWGHAVSTDLIHWRDLPYAIKASGEKQCWSGSTLVEDDRVIAMYYGHPNGERIAVSNDPLLLDWTNVSAHPVIPVTGPVWTHTTGREKQQGVSGGSPPARAINFVYDPCIWKKDGIYYALSGGALLHGPGGQRMRAGFLFRSRDLLSWEYLHQFLEDDIFGLPGDDLGCPYFWPIGDRHILLHYSHMSGGKYMIGDYDTDRDRFIVSYGGRFNFGPSGPAGVHAPSATPDGKGGVIVIFNMNPAKPTPGWDQLMGLPRRLSLPGKDGAMTIEPAGDIESLRGEHHHIEALNLPANREIVLEGVQGNAIEMAAEIDLADAPMVELNVLRSPGREEFTRIAVYRQRGYVDWNLSGGFKRYEESRDTLIAIDTSYSSVLPDVKCRAPEAAPVYLPPGELLKLRVFIDRSILEVFVNGRQCLAVRLYPGREDSVGVSLRSQGAPSTLRSLDVWQMRGIYHGP
jgi:beta-fructofuranosidase